MQKDNEKEPMQATPAGRVEGHLDDWDDLAIDYLDGLVDEPTRKAIETHLDGCASCASRLGLQRGVCDLLERTGMEDAPAGLEDQVLGEVLFPKKTAKAMTQPEPRQPSWWSGRWQRKWKAWVPAAVGVAAVLAALASYGLIQGTSSTEVVTSKGLASTTAAVASAPPTAERSSESATNQDTAGALTTTTAAAATTSESLLAAGTSTAAGPTTTAGATTTTGPGATGFGVEIIEDRKRMISEFKTAAVPVYFVFQSGAYGDGKAVATVTSADLAQQITQLTGLQPLDQSLSVQGTTFAAYVSRDQAAQFVDLLRSIGATLQLTLGMAFAPVDASERTTGEGFGASLHERAGTIPEVHASRTPQPAVSDWTFTTSTLLPANEAESPPPGWQPPDQDGSHVLVVIYLGL